MIKRIVLCVVMLTLRAGLCSAVAQDAMLPTKSAAAPKGAAASQPAARPVTPLPDMAVPKDGWSSMKPNPTVAGMPDNTWMFLPCTFVPKSATSFADFKFGQDYGGFGHPKTEVVLVYDEARNVTIWFGGCSSGYINQTVLMSVSDAVCYQAQPEHVDLLRTGKDIAPKFATSRPHGQCSYGACYDSDHRVYQPVEKVLLTRVV